MCTFTGCGCTATHSGFQLFWGVFFILFFRGFFLPVLPDGSQRVLYETIITPRAFICQWTPLERVHRMGSDVLVAPERGGSAA
jgi:hypothetical protein